MPEPPAAALCGRRSRACRSRSPRAGRRGPCAARNRRCRCRTSGSKRQGSTPCCCSRRSTGASCGVHRHADAVEGVVRRGHVVEAGRGRAALDEHRAGEGGEVRAVDVDVGGEALHRGLAEAAFLQLVAQFGGAERQRNRVRVAERGRDRQLGVVAGEVRRLVEAGVALRDVGLRAPDHVARALGGHVVERVLAEQVRDDKAVLERFEHLLERNGLLLVEGIGHRNASRERVEPVSEARSGGCADLRAC
jgi:hypothetical protein